MALDSGDSYTQTGFVFDIKGALPAPGNPNGHPDIGIELESSLFTNLMALSGTNTWSLGPNYVEWLVTTFNQTEVFA